MYEAENEIKKPRPTHSALSSPADNEDDSDKGISDDLFYYKVNGKKEDFVKFQYDMLLQKEQYDKLMVNDGSLPPHRSRRNAINDKAMLWPNGRIPYTIDDKFNEKQKYIIKEAIDMWNKWTCLSIFESVNNEDNQIKFKKKQTGCGESFVGMMQWKQFLSLSHKCANKVEVVAHEIGHAIGLYHEHMRHDRDKYVVVHYNNLDNSTTVRENFKTLRQNEYQNFSKPYDYLSIMHYGKTFFSRNKTANLVTMSPKNESYLDIIGEVETISFYDAKIVCQVYNCAAKCNSKCFGTSFMGAECQCMCRGPSDDNPIRHCPIRGKSTGNKANRNCKLCKDNRCRKLVKKRNIFQHGSEIYSRPKSKKYEMFRDEDGYLGKDVIIHKQIDGQWEKPFPFCIGARCEIKRNCNVTISYINGSATGLQVPSSSDVIVACKDTSKHELQDFSKCKKNPDGTAKCTCSMGVLKVPTCKPKKCPNKDLPDILKSQATKKDPRQRIDYNDASKHSAKRFLRCYDKQEVLDSVTNTYIDATGVEVKCEFGKWIPKSDSLGCVPKRCRLKVCDNSKYWYIQDDSIVSITKRRFIDHGMNISTECKDGYLLTNTHGQTSDTNQTAQCNFGVWQNEYQCTASINYTLLVYTDNDTYAGTSSSVNINITGRNGSTGELRLADGFAKETLYLKTFNVFDVGEIFQIRLSLIGSDQWKPRWIALFDKVKGYCFKKLNMYIATRTTVDMSTGNCSNFEDAIKIDYDRMYLPRNPTPNVDDIQCKLLCAQQNECMGVLYYVNVRTCYLIKQPPYPARVKDKSHKRRWFYLFYKKI